MMTQNPQQFVTPENWNERTILGMGGYAVVYDWQGQALKVGGIEPDEVEAQRHFAGQGLALPVLGYWPEIDLPESISREVCPVHGVRREILPAEHQSCSSGEPQAALLMPVADGGEADELRAFIAGFAQDCEQQLGRFWDTRPGNVARYRGRLVALDFGIDF